MAMAIFVAAPAIAQDQRPAIEASTPLKTAVTIYRDPNRRTGQAMNRRNPRGFAMISETRTVTLPPGQSTIRFTGVAEGMVAVSAIVTGLPGGTIEKNRNADLLSPAALVDGTLGNRIQITRTNPGTGEEETENAIVRTRADGGLVLQTGDGYEAVRCAGLPERLSFPAVPDGLSAQPVFSVDTRDDRGGTYTVTLSYLAWGFDWEANYVATMQEGGSSDDVRFDLVSWLTLLNDNGQTFADAELMAVAGRLNVTSDYGDLADPPEARPLRLTCYPIGSTAAGSPLGSLYPPPPAPSPPPPPAMMARMTSADELQESSQAIVVTGMKVMASEEDLGDLKLYRVPFAADVAAQSLKQIAFLRRDGVKGRMLYQAMCDPYDSGQALQPARLLLETENDEEHGLGVALPTGNMAVFERGPRGELLVGEETLRDYASGQDVEISLGTSAQVFAECARLTDFDPQGSAKWSQMRASMSNANPAPVTVRLVLGAPVQWRVRGLTTRIKDGQTVTEVVVPANETIELNWEIRPAVAR